MTDSLQLACAALFALVVIVTVCLLEKKLK
jgi:hypothetical protein